VEGKGEERREDNSRDDLVVSSKEEGEERLGFTLLCEQVKRRTS
jgi:hypothetical protein